MPIGELTTLIVVLIVLASALRQIRQAGPRAWIGMLLILLLMAPYVAGGVLLILMLAPEKPGASDGQALSILAVFLVYLIAGIIPVTKVAKRIQMKYMPPER